MRKDFPFRKGPAIATGTTLVMGFYIPHFNDHPIWLLTFLVATRGSIRICCKASTFMPNFPFSGLTIWTARLSNSANPPEGSQIQVAQKEKNAKMGTGKSICDFYDFLQLSNY
jgi:hypothetical protein